MMCKGRPGFVPGVEANVFVPGFVTDFSMVPSVLQVGIINIPEPPCQLSTSLFMNA